MGEVMKFYPPGSGKRADAVLEQAVGVYDSVFIIGRDLNGEMNVRASTNIDDKDVLWLIEHFKLKLLNGDYSEEEEI